MREAAMELKALGELKHLLGFLAEHPADLVCNGQHWWAGWQPESAHTGSVHHASPIAALRAYKKTVLTDERIARRRIRSTQHD